jgi:hypothetical protein
MAPHGIVQIAAGLDGSSYAEALRERLAGQARGADGTAPAALRPPHESAVLVFILTPDAFAIYGYLRTRGFDAFLDTEDDAIEAGKSRSMCSPSTRCCPFSSRSALRPEAGPR